MKKLYTLLTLSMLFAMILPTYAQLVSVRGQVLDENKAPLMGATIIVKETQQGTTTDLNGEYTIKVNKRNTLVYSYLGYETLSAYVGDKQLLNVTLKSNAEVLDEVVVVGYGTLRKSDLTGAVSSVDSGVLANADNSSFMSSLAGKVTGVQVIQNSGVPGGATTVKIRGNNSMGDSEPLYVVDGVPYSTASIEGFESEGAAISPLSLINPADIKSMEILKDASATAIYGAEASNGVILITTKSGSEGKAVVNAGLEFGISKLMNKIDMLDANEYIIIRNEAYVNAGSNSPYSMSTLMAANRGSLTTYDWQDILFKQGKTMNANLGVSGGTKVIKYMVSLNGYLGDGIIPKSDYKRISGRSNLTFDVSSKVSAGVNISVSAVTTSGLPASTNLGTGRLSGVNSIVSRALLTSPLLSPNDEFVTVYDPYADDSGYDFNTPLQQINATTQQNNLFQFLSNMFVTYKITKSLSFRASANISQVTNAARYYQSRAIKSGYDYGGWARLNDTKNSNFVNDYLLTYNKQFNKDHRLNMVVGSTLRKMSSQTQKVSVKNFPDDRLLWYDLNSGVDHESTTNTFTDVKSVSWYERTNYTMKNRYIFTLTARVDGNSKFADGNKFGFFPAGAFAWRVTQEPWMKQYRNLSNLKLRLSYGITGNQNLSSYSTLSRVSSELVNLGNSSSDDDLYAGYIFSTSMPDQDLKWESTRQLNAGVDIGLLKNRLTFELDFYSKYTNDLLVGVQIPEYSGYLSSTMNFGEMRNNGVEFGVNYDVVKTKKFNWRSSINISHNKTIVMRLDQDNYESGYSLPYNGQYTQRLIEGEELGLFYGYERDGILQTGESSPYTFAGVELEAGEQKYVDQNGDGVLDESDMVILGQAQPDFVFGFNNTFNYGNFDLTIYIDGQYGNDICNINSVRGLMFDGGVQFATVMERWTEDNPSNEYPKVDINNISTSFLFSDRYIEDGSYIRLSKIVLGYTMPSKMLSKFGVNTMRFYASASNLYTLTKYTGYSPDVSLGGGNNLQMGHDSGAYPNPLTVTVGVNLTF